MLNDLASEMLHDVAKHEEIDPSQLVIMWCIAAMPLEFWSKEIRGTLGLDEHFEPGKNCGCPIHGKTVIRDMSTDIHWCRLCNPEIFKDGEP